MILGFKTEQDYIHKRYVPAEHVWSCCQWFHSKMDIFVECCIKITSKSCQFNKKMQLDFRFPPKCTEKIYALKYKIKLKSSKEYKDTQFPMKADSDQEGNYILHPLCYSDFFILPSSTHVGQSILGLGHLFQGKSMYIF